MLRPKRQSSNTVTVTAPVGGWNAASSLAMMGPTEAVIMDNWFCLPTEIMARKGFTPWATGVTGTIESFINYDATDNSHKSFAVANNAGSCAIYDVTASGAVGSAVLTGLSNARWHYAQVSNSGGTFTLAANGHDNVLIYDGTSWQAVTGTSTPFAITGVDTTHLADVIVHKRRAWFVERNSLKGWYLDTDAVAGTAHSFDFGPLFKMGGHLVKLETYTLDAGNGMDDYFVAITSAGEVAIYTGTNPASSTDWSLSGVYYVGSPVGNQSCTCKYGGDVLLLNKDGLIPLSQALMSSRVSTRMTISTKIQNQITLDTSNYASNYGWQVILFPPENILMVNVPVSSSLSYQYVMNTITGAWSRWTGLNGVCWTFINEKLFFGLNGKVFKAWDGYNDNGSAINTDLLPAFSAFGSQSQIKRFTMARIFMGTDNQFSYAGQINVDFDKLSTPGVQQASPMSSAGVWDTAVWDTGTWGGDIYSFARWLQGGQIGHYGTFRLKTSSNNSDVRYYSTDYVFEPGGVL